MLDWISAAQLKSFQSTPARGGRPENSPVVNSSAESFNPRPRAAGDKRRVKLMWERQGFNPRPRAAGDSRIEVTTDVY